MARRGCCGHILGHSGLELVRREGRWHERGSGDLWLQTLLPLAEQGLSQAAETVASTFVAS